MPKRRNQIAMTEEEQAAFLREGHTLQVASMGPHGYPHLAAMWYALIDGKVHFTTYARSQKVQNLRRNPLNPPAHFAGRPPRKRHQQNPPRIGAIDHQMGDAMRQRIGLSRTRAGDHQQRPRPRLARAMLHRPALFRVERIEIVEAGKHESELSE